ncbi:hypothetical protein SAMN05428981_11442 [Bacillus sp. OV194]|nr:hypothetical protein SAMN05428981_11442 [Bacillus sp. OV194]
MNTTTLSINTTKPRVLVINALFIGLTFVATFINFKLPIMGNGGLIHLGKVPLYLKRHLFSEEK